MMDEDQGTPTQDEQERLDTEAYLKKQAALVAVQAREDLREVSATVAGRAFIWDLLSKCGLYADDFRGENTHEMARYSGRRSIGLELLKDLFTADPHAYSIIRDQAMARRASREKR